MEESNHPMAIALQAAVPLHIMELQAKGGPTEHDYARARAAGQLIAEKGDILQYRGGKKGESAQVFNALAFALAVGSYVPGGIKFLGTRWVSKRPIMPSPEFD